MEVTNLLGETAELISSILKSVLSKKGLNLSDLVALSADNENVRYGGTSQTGSNNICTNVTRAKGSFYYTRLHDT